MSSWGISCVKFYTSYIHVKAGNEKYKKIISQKALWKMYAHNTRTTHTMISFFIIFNVKSMSHLAIPDIYQLSGVGSMHKYSGHDNHINCK